jgi:hypothetical protein
MLACSIRGDVKKNTSPPTGGSRKFFLASSPSDGSIGLLSPMRLDGKLCKRQNLTAPAIAIMFLRAANESHDRITGFAELERAMGIEATSEGREASVLPPNYARSSLRFESYLHMTVTNGASLYIIAPTMPSRETLINVADGLATVTLNRPDKLKISRRAARSFSRSAPLLSPSNQNPQ